MSFRGIASILLGSIPATENFEKGLMVLSCSDENAARLETELRKRFERTVWTVFRRAPSAPESAEERIIYSMQINTAPLRRALIRKLRGEKFDIVAVAWTGEPTYVPLKVFSVFSNFRYYLVLESASQSFYLVPANLARLLAHAWTQWKARTRRWSSLVYLVGSIVLYPFGLLYLLGQIVRYLFVRIVITPILAGRRSNQD